MDIPDELLRHIYEYNLHISVPNKMIHHHILQQKSLFETKLQNWYRKNKIDSTMPILFISDFTENPDQFQKWYILRLFMKFYPREDLRDCNKEGRTNMDKWRYTLITTVLFFIVVNPYTYKFVNFLLKRFFKIADKSGCPTFAGVLVHTVVFTLLLRGLMEMKL